MFINIFKIFYLYFMKSLVKIISRFMIAFLAIASMNSSALAIELDEATRTVALNSTKDRIVLAGNIGFEYNKGNKTLL